jgi:hypothetical protein
VPQPQKARKKPTKKPNKQTTKKGSKCKRKRSRCGADGDCCSKLLACYKTRKKGAKRKRCRPCLRAANRLCGPGRPPCCRFLGLACVAASKRRPGGNNGQRPSAVIRRCRRRYRGGE